MSIVDPNLFSFRYYALLKNVDVDVKYLIGVRTVSHAARRISSNGNRKRGRHGQNLPAGVLTRAYSANRHLRNLGFDFDSCHPSSSTGL